MVLETQDAAINGARRQELPLMSRNESGSMSLAPGDKKMKDVLKANGESVSASAPGGHIRSYFPEALYINPEILTNGDGNASITIPLADSITTWRLAILASTRAGALGTGSSELKVFQDFFVDLDLPVTLTQGDTVSIPVAVYNYGSLGGDVTLKLAPEDWFSLESADQQTISVGAGQVGGAHFTIAANKIGKFKLTLAGRSSRTEAGTPTHSSSTKARQTASTRIVCALQLISRGLSSRRTTKESRLNGPSNLSRNIWTTRWMLTRSLLSRISP